MGSSVPRKNGYPFVFGFAVLSSFQTAEVARTGKMVMPQPTDQQLGGHAVTAVGYDDFQQCFIVRNSWGEGLLVRNCFCLLLSVRL